MNTLEALFDGEFIEYLKRVEVDLRESGHDATADDYKEARRRLQIFNDASIYSEEYDATEPAGNSILGSFKVGEDNEQAG